MSTHRYQARPAWVITAALTLAVSGCALTRKADPYEPRVFAVEVATPASQPAPAPAAGPPLTLGRVTSAAYLRKRMVVRRSPLEVATHEDRRWAETPQEYARRAVVSELFEKRGLRRDYSGRAPIIDIELLSFEELRWKGVGRVRVAMSFVVRHEGSALDSGVITVEEEAASEAPEEVTRALSRALERAAEHVGERVVSSLPPAE